MPQNGQPVFDLPPGSTASSLALGIVDNVVPGPETPSSGVPAPASLLLVALGCVAAMGGRGESRSYGRTRAAARSPRAASTTKSAARPT